MCMIFPSQHHRSKYLSLWLVFTFCQISAIAADGDISKAKELYKQARFTEVDQALHRELALASPSKEVLQLSLDAALATGRIITAQKRITRLLQICENKNPRLVFQGATIAEMAGDNRLSTTRYLIYLRLQSAKNSRTQEALLRVLHSGGYPSLYRRLVAQCSTGVDVWRIGHHQIDLLLKQEEPRKAVEIGKLLVQRYPKRAHVESVASRFQRAGERLLMGSDPRVRGQLPLDLILLPEASPIDEKYYEHFYNIASHRMTPNDRLSYIVKIQKKYGSPWRNMFNKLDEMRKLEDSAARLKAGRSYLALEPMFKKKATDYEAYLYKITWMPEVFKVPGRALVSPAKMTEKFWTLKKMSKRDQHDIGAKFFADFCNRWISSDRRAAFYRRNVDILPLSSLQDWIQRTEGRIATQDLDAYVGQSLFRRVSAERYLIPYYNRYESKKRLIAAAKLTLRANPASFDINLYRQHFVNSKILSTEEKVRVLTTIIKQAGAGASLRRLCHDLLKEKSNPKLGPLKALFKSRPRGTHALMSTYVMLTDKREQRRSNNTELNAHVRSMLALCKTEIPGSLSEARVIEELLLLQVQDKQRRHCWDNKQAIVEWASMWAPRMRLGSRWDALIRRPREHNAHEELMKSVFPHFSNRVQAGEKVPVNLWYRWGEVATFKNSESPLLGSNMISKMPATLPLRIVFSNRQHFDRNSKELFKLYDRAGRASNYAVATDLLRQFTDALIRRANKSTHLSPTFAASLARQWHHQMVADTGVLDHGVCKSLIRIYRRAKMNAEADAEVKWYMGEAHTSTAKSHVYAHLLEPGILSNGAGPYQFDDVLFNRYLPFLRNQPQHVYPKHVVSGNAIAHLAHLIHRKDKRSKACKAALTDLGNMLAQGMGYTGNWATRYAALDAARAAAIDKKNCILLNKIVLCHAQYQHEQWQALAKHRIEPMVSTLESHGLHEISFAYLKIVSSRHQIPPKYVSQINVMRAKAAQHIPGLIAVNPRDPAYPLHLAAHAFTLGSEAHAWELASKKIKILPKHWESLDPSFVAWFIEEMRKQKMLKEALDLSFLVLLKEQMLAPQVAAEVTLAKGDIYRDMSNPQSAKAEYESLMANRRYANTSAGRAARLHLISLLIDTGDYPNAQKRLEQMVNSSSINLQAEAYYFKGRIAYAQQDYQHSREMLDEVFKRSHDHINARLLEGELKLKLPRGLIDLEVAVGNKKLATTAIPGRPLSLKLQDTNLSIARGGSAIPVVIATSKGGDEEYVKLLPSAADKAVFAGSIPTALGIVQKHNSRLEIRGDDVVSYRIAPEFQKTNGLNYASKTLRVRAGARLVVSSGEILSKADADKRELQRRLNQTQDKVSARFRGRQGTIVRPGSPIFAEVTDYDRDLTDAKDKVSVDLHTSSGDILNGFELTETSAHSGIFRGKIPTGTPAPLASASDTEEGKSPASMINSSLERPWTSLADGKAPKWVEVDTMSSHLIQTSKLLMPNTRAIRRLSLMGLFDEDDYELLGTYPANHASEERGGLTVTFARDAKGHSPKQIRRYLRFAKTKTYHQVGTLYSRGDTQMKGRNGWAVTRITGAFFLREPKRLKMKFIHTLSPHNWQYTHVYIDGRRVMGGALNPRSNIPTNIHLTRDVHRLEILMVDHWRNSALQLGVCEDGSDEYKPMPEEWFDISKNRELATAVKSKATIQQTRDGFVASFSKPVRLRKLRWVFSDFASRSLTVKEMQVTASGNKKIIPVTVDFTSGLKNRVLEVSPGDEISCSYIDALNLESRGPKKHLETLSSSFFNGTIVLANEDIRQGRGTTFRIAKRCRVGTQLMVFVNDADHDTTDKRDRILVDVRTSSGEQLRLEALETNPAKDQSHEHAGVFMAIIRFGSKTAGGTIKLSLGDQITVGYLDTENTSPGVPVTRSYTLFEVGTGTPRIDVYRTSTSLVADRSATAQRKLRQIKRTTKKGQNVRIMRREIRAVHPELVTRQRKLAGDLIPVSANAPILFQVRSPQQAMHAGSVVTAVVVSETELALAKKQNRKPDQLEVPMTITTLSGLAARKGYRVSLVSPQEPHVVGLLEQGLFSGVVRLQVGSHGDQTDDLVTIKDGQIQNGSTSERNKVPTLLVSGSDIVQIRVKSVTSGETTVARIKLMSDARLELLDSTYTFERAKIHLGEKLYVRINDPDQDKSDRRDKVDLQVRAESGDAFTLKLEETFAHSGTFTGSLTPVFLDNRQVVSATDDKLHVKFGDHITFTFIDSLALSCDKALTVNTTGQIRFGANGELASFTKRFKDKEVAVRTRFLMAEALFEMAKEHRKLNKIKLAKSEVSRGKRNLEEAMRDYPNTALAAQGQFLLANLAQELGKHLEAIGRYSQVISNWPDSEYAPRSQFKKALCLEQKKDYKQATEEYVKLTYLYPESSLVADAMIRLANHFYKTKKYKIAGKVFYRFQERNPNHRLAVKAIFLAGQCQMRQEDYAEAARTFERMMKDYPDTDKQVLAEGLYWLAEAYVRTRNHRKAYQNLKRLTWDYPESKWAKFARGRLTEDQFSRMD